MTRKVHNYSGYFNRYGIQQLPHWDKTSHWLITRSTYDVTSSGRLHSAVHNTGSPFVKQYTHGVLICEKRYYKMLFYTYFIQYLLGLKFLPLIMHILQNKNNLTNHLTSWLWYTNVGLSAIKMFYPRQLRCTARDQPASDPRHADTAWFL